MSSAWVDCSLSDELATYDETRLVRLFNRALQVGEKLINKCLMHAMKKPQFLQNRIGLPETRMPQRFVSKRPNG